ncbi:unnamed protein product [Parnassius mnemosyne]|uniref:PiggyBac transposable element-derived protein domain-containing protein n=1 Tax=Parnassius mnemosyne TaxID=213953 RepID=A0AAV1LZ96_9NEOP
MKYLRFDLRKTRNTRLYTDKFAMVSDIWNKFIENCEMCYIPGENMTVEEQLFPSKTRYRFLQYITNKPDKFGIKFLLLVNVERKYLCGGFPYLGKDVERLILYDISLPEHVVMKLLIPYL